MSHLPLPFALLCIAWLGLGCVKLPGTETLARHEDRQSYALQGQGSPIVILEAGLGGDKTVWRDVFEPVSRFTRVLAYDRAGYGASRSAAPDRDGETVVRELRGLLHDLELAPPYILVGHSLGGQYVELFARMHPSEVTGVVLVDARHVDFSDRCRPEGVERCEPPLFARLFMPSAARAELRGIARTESQIRKAPPFSAIPLRVLTATQRPENLPNLRRLWAETQADFLQLSPNATQEICSDCSHFIQHDAPERVIEAIRSITQLNRKGRTPDSGLQTGQ